MLEQLRQQIRRRKIDVEHVASRRRVAAELHGRLRLRRDETAASRCCKAGVTSSFRLYCSHTRVRSHDATEPSAANSQQPYTRRLYASKQHGGVFDVDHRRQSCRSIWRKRSYAKANANASTVKASRPSRLVTFKSASFRTSVHEDTAKSDGTSGKRPTLQSEADVFAKTSSQWSL